MNKLKLGKFSIEVDGDNVTINSSSSSSIDKDSIIIKDTIFKEDFHGNIQVKSDGVKIIIEGDMHGNIVGNCDIDIKGDVIGNMVGNITYKR